ncbi:hypothetical protein EV421DRAFT_2001284 [Armillaria borealis]|uniref:Uncharacterized protein n=1 Tax=Armillaria borealis TaxID=47425 RepID=A0AA39MFV5_9AGAR|nr:hypothetical protein EV421DRAFT_2001284 [Armillaria borealis]
MSDLDSETLVFLTSLLTVAVAVTLLQFRIEAAIIWVYPCGIKPTAIANHSEEKRGMHTDQGEGSCDDCNGSCPGREASGIASSCYFSFLQCTLSQPAGKLAANLFSHLTMLSTRALNMISLQIASSPYEPHQKIHTFASRYAKSGQYDTAIDVLFQSVRELLKMGQASSGTDLAVFILDVYKTKGETANDNSRDRLMQLIALTGSSGS